MISATQIRVGNILKIENELYRVLKVHHVTPGKGNAVVQTDLRNLRTGIKNNQRFRSTESVETVEVYDRKMEFLYQDGGTYHFMDPETFEQLELSADFLDEAVRYLKPQAAITISRYEDKPVSVSLAPRLTFEVAECDAPAKGMAGATKDATLENGLKIRVPLFIKVGDLVVVDTESGDYIEKG